jgi:hypothetical protein
VLAAGAVLARAVLAGAAEATGAVVTVGLAPQAARTASVTISPPKARERRSLRIGVPSLFVVIPAFLR